MKQIEIIKDVLDANRVVAEENRKLLKEAGVFAINLMGSPGSGKTTVLERTLEHIAGKMWVGIIQGDITTSLDSERLQRFNVPIVQINTEPFGGDCHLGANLVQKALHSFDLNQIQLLVIENVGNLVCPAEFDIGENLKAVVFSVTEGEEKPLKYPLMFRECGLVLISKLDLLQYLDVKVEKMVENIRKINSQSKIIPLSAKTGEGMEDWVAFLKQKCK